MKTKLENIIEKALSGQVPLHLQKKLSSYIAGFLILHKKEIIKELKR